MAKKYNLKGHIIAALRRVFLYSPMRRDALNKAKVGSKYKCAKCKKRFTRKLVTVDHINPVVDPTIGFPQVIGYFGPQGVKEVDNWTRYIDNMMHCKLQVLCKVHHKQKTAKERKIATARRRKEKENNNVW